MTVPGQKQKVVILDFASALGHKQKLSFVTYVHDMPRRGGGREAPAQTRRYSHFVRFSKQKQRA